MASWEDKILSAADKIANGIDKGTDALLNRNTQNIADSFQYPQSQGSEDRNVKHCPSCGHTISSIDLFCPACGSSLEDAKASSAAQALAHNLSVIDSQKEGMIRNFVRTHQDKISEKATQKAQMIKTFPVPNTKKDMLEFIHMASSNINARVLVGDTYGMDLDDDALKTEKLLSQTWLDKMESIYQKAKTLLAGDFDLSKIEAVYIAKKQEINSLREKMNTKNKKSNKVGLVLAVLLVIGLAVGVYFGIMGERKEKIAKTDGLEALVVEIRQDITDGNYDSALLKTNKVRLKNGGTAEEEAKWDRERETLIKEIEKARSSNTD